MSPILIILGALPWLLLLLHQIFRRDFTVLLVLLFIAPVATNLLERTEGGLIYETSGTVKDVLDKDFYYEQPAVVTWQKLVNPTRTLLGLLLMVFVLNAVLLKKTRWVPLDKTEIWMGIFSVILLANVLLWSGRIGYGLRIAVDAYMVPFFSYCLARRLVTTEDRFRQLTRVIGYMAAYVILYSLFERVTTPGLFYRVRGPFQDGGSTVYVVLTVAFFMALLESKYDGRLGMKRGILPPVIRSLVLYLTPVIVALTTVRGNYVGFLLGVGIFVMLGRRLASFSRRTAGTVGGILLLISIIAASLPLVVPGQFFEERVADSENILGRYATWMATLGILSKAPIFGVGLNNLQGLLATQIVSVGGFWNYSSPHNAFLSMITELGIVGLVAYLAILVTIIKMGLRLYRTGPRLQDRWRGVALLAVMVAYLTPSMFAHLLAYTGEIHVYVYIFAGTLAGIYGRNQLPALSQRYIRRHRSVNQNYPVAAVR